MSYEQSTGSEKQLLSEMKEQRKRLGASVLSSRPLSSRGGQHLQSILIDFVTSREDDD
jgi:hypothetical protein